MTQFSWNVYVGPVEAQLNAWLEDLELSARIHVIHRNDVHAWAKRNRISLGTLSQIYTELDRRYPAIRHIKPTKGISDTRVWDIPRRLQEVTV